MKETIVIIGAGSVGVNAALFLAKMGYDVELIESKSDILLGAPQVTFVNHGDGFEYFKPNHIRTGKFCIDGTFVKGLIYPLDSFKTDICGHENPIRFFLSKQSINKDGLSTENFERNALGMKNHFQKQFNSVLKAKKIDKEEGNKLFLRTPDSFYKVLNKIEYTDVANVVGGCAGSSFGINMPHYYAFLKSAISQFENITFTPFTNTEHIEKNGEQYLVHSNSRTIKTNCILVMAGIAIPNLSKKITGTSLSKLDGTFYLNCMTFVKLPATDNLEKIKNSKHINFTLQADGGGMFACVVKPTYTEDGFAALYYPSQKGSQLFSKCFTGDSKSSIPVEWNSLIENGLEKNNKNVQNTFQHSCLLYPFLEDYAEVTRAVCRPVFNVKVFGNNKGQDRRVRDILTTPIMLSSDEKISMWTAPKWTNAEIVALMAVDHVNKVIRKKELPKFGKTQFGPTGLDVAEISKTINFYDVKMNRNDALWYAENQGIPKRVVDLSI